jgi:HlyD family secretion protein
VLLGLWNDDLIAQVQLAESETRAAIARRRASCAQADIAAREAQRLQNLKASGAASLDAIDRAASEARAARASCDAAAAAVEVSAAQVGMAQAQLARTILHAPFDGVVAEISAELNEVVTPSPVGIATPPAIDLIADDCFYVRAPIDEVDAAAVQVGLPARIALDAFGERRFEGRVRRISDYVLDREKQARTVDVEVEFSDPHAADELLAGYSADVEIVLETRSDVLRLPSAAVLDGDHVLILGSDGRLAEHAVEVGLANWDNSEIVSGLDGSEQVVENLGDDGVVAGALAKTANDAAAQK